MNRLPINDEVLTRVLVRSRRRCCLCFGLNRDLGPKPGQVAHLNQKRDDNREDNLAFLCLEHHDAYDSRTSQSKGLTLGEVRTYRQELYSRLEDYLRLPVHFGDLILPAEDPIAGTWIRSGNGIKSAEVTLTPVQDSLEGNARYAVTGFALVGLDRPGGPNMGDLAFLADLHDGVLVEGDPKSQPDRYWIQLAFKYGQLIVDEGMELGKYGMGVTFRGDYNRAR